MKITYQPTRWGGAKRVEALLPAESLAALSVVVAVPGGLRARRPRRAVEVQALPAKADRPDVVRARAAEVARCRPSPDRDAVQVVPSKCSMVGRRSLRTISPPDARPHVTFAARPDRIERSVVAEAADVDLRPGITGAALNHALPNEARRPGSQSPASHTASAPVPQMSRAPRSSHLRRTGYRPDCSCTIPSTRRRPSGRGTRRGRRRVS